MADDSLIDDKPPFDPTKPFSPVAVEDKPAFDPSQPFQPLDATDAKPAPPPASPEGGNFVDKGDFFDVIGSYAKNLARGAESGLASAVHGAAGLAQTSPAELAGGPNALGVSAQERMNFVRESKDPLIQWARQDPGTQNVNLTPDEQKLPGAGLVQGAGSFLPLLAAGPTAPFVMAMQSAGEHITNDYDEAIKSGLPPEAAAERTFQNASKAGLTDEALWSVLPPVLRSVGDKYLIDKFGVEGVKRFLAGRAAQVGEGAALGAATRIADNTATGHEIFKGVGDSAAQLALAQVLFPRGATEKEAAAGPPVVAEGKTAADAHVEQANADAVKLAETAPRTAEALKNDLAPAQAGGIVAAAKEAAATPPPEHFERAGEQERLSPEKVNDFTEWAKNKSLPELQRLRQDHIDEPTPQSQHAVEVLDQVIGDRQATGGEPARAIAPEGTTAPQPKGTQPQVVASAFRDSDGKVYSAGADDPFASSDAVQHEHGATGEPGFLAITKEGGPVEFVDGKKAGDIAKGAVISTTADKLGLKYQGNGMGGMEFIDTQHGGNLSIPVGATPGEIKQYRDIKREQFAASPETWSKVKAETTPKLERLREQIKARNVDKANGAAVESTNGPEAQARLKEVAKRVGESTGENNPRPAESLGGGSIVGAEGRGAGDRSSAVEGRLGLNYKGASLHPVLERIANDSRDPTVRSLARLLTGLGLRTKIGLTDETLGPGYPAAYYREYDAVLYRKGARASESDAHEIVLEEGLHAATAWLVDHPTTDRAKAFVTELQRIRDLAAQHPDAEKFKYVLQDTGSGALHELVAGIGRKDVRDFLNSVPDPDGAKGATLLSRFRAALFKAIGIKPGSAMESLAKTLWDQVGDHPQDRVAPRGTEILGSEPPPKQEEEKPRFYSQLERTIAAQPDKASAEQLRAAVLKGPGIKQAELHETKDQFGTTFEQFLKDNPKATKSEMLDFVRENQVQLKEVSKSEHAKAREASEMSFEDYPRNVRETAQELQQEAGDRATEDFYMDPPEGYSVEEVDRSKEEAGRGAGETDLFGHKIEPLPAQYRVLVDGDYESFDDMRGYYKKYATENEDGEAVFDSESHAEDYLREAHLDSMQDDARDENYREWSRENPVENFLDDAIEREGFERDEDSGEHPGDEVGPTKYDQYKLPGGHDYGETLATLPESGGEQFDPSKVKIKRGNNDVIVSYGKQTIGTFAAARHEPDSWFIDNVKNRFEQGQNGLNKTQFKSGHWSEPNIILHLRHDMRDLPDGSKMFLLEEEQSDWAQKGRQSGYQSEVKPAEISEAEEKANAAEKTYRELKKRFGVDQQEAGYNYTNAPLSTPPTGRYGDISDLTGGKQPDSAVGESFAVMNILNQAYDKFTAARDNVSALYAKKSQAVPDMPFKGNAWKTLGLKIALRKAIESGASRLGWTTGEQQADRYNLSQHVDAIRVGKNESGYFFEADPKGRGGQVKEAGLTEQQLASNIGKDLAKKAIAELPEHQAVTGSGSYITYDGLDLKVGGEGMKGFYDKELVNIANDLGKKFGAKVEDVPIGEKAVVSQVGREWHVKIPHGDLQKFSDQAGAEKYAERYNSDLGVPIVHSLPITDEMRKAVLENGQPLFSGQEPSDASKMGEDEKGFIHGMAEGLGGKPDKTPHDFALLGADKYLSGATTFGEWRKAMLDEVGTDTPFPVRKTWADANALIQDFHNAQVGAEPTSVKAQVEQSAGLQERSGSVREQLANSVTKANALSGYLGGMEKGSKLGGEARQKQLRMADRWLNADQEAVRKSLTDFVNQLLPPDERGAFIGQIGKALARPDLVRGTAESLYLKSYQVMAAIEARAKDVYARDLHEEIRGLQKSLLNSGAVSIEAKDALRELFSEVSTNTPTAASAGRLRSLAANLYAAGKKIPNYLQEKLVSLTKTPIKNLSVEELEALRDEAKRIGKFGKEQWKGFKQAREHDQQLREVDLAQQTTIKPNEALEKMARDTDVDRWQKIKDSLWNTAASTGNWLNVHEKARLFIPHLFDTMDGKANGWLTRNVLKPLYTALRAYNADVDPVKTRAVELVKQHNLEHKDFINIGLHAHFTQEGTAEELLKYSTDPGLAKVIADYQRNGLTPGQQHLYDFFRKTLDANTGAMKEFFANHYNKELTFYDNYFPRSIDARKSATWRAGREEWVNPVTKEKIDINNVADVVMHVADIQARSRSIRKGFAEARKEGASIPINLNSMEVFLKHMDDWNYVKNVQPHLNMVGKLANTNLFAARYGQVGKGLVLDYIDALAKRGQYSKNYLERAIDGIKNRAMVGLLGFRPTQLKHLASYPMGMNEAGNAVWWAHGVRALHSTEGRALAERLFPEIFTGSAGDISIREASGAEGGLGKAAFAIDRVLDLQNRGGTALGSYFRQLSEAGHDWTNFPNIPDNADMANNARTAYVRSVGSAETADRPLLVTRGTSVGSKSLGTAMMAYQTPKMVRWGTLRSAIMNDLYRDHNPTAAARKISVLTASSLIEASIKYGSRAGYVAGASALLAALGFSSKAPKKDSGETPAKDMVTEAATDFLSNLPLVGGLAGKATAAIKYPHSTRDIYGRTDIPPLDMTIAAFQDAGSLLHDPNAKNAFSFAGDAATLSGLPVSIPLQLGKQAVKSSSPGKHLGDPPRRKKAGFGSPK